MDAVIDLAANLSSTDLFLTGVFKTFVSPAVSREVLGWFGDKLVTVYRADRVRALYRPAKMATSTPYIEKAVNEAARTFGISSNAVGYMVPEASPSLGCSLFSRATTERGERCLPKTTSPSAPCASSTCSR